ncbi:MAG: hypothetical protein HY561_00445 [Gemmatimonadetes bacterium]|nr:hypothetical protein [Gemmatimonadota bacterium]
MDVRPFLAELKRRRVVRAAGLSHRRRQAYEALGERENVARHYARFVELWKECEPELRPLREDARRRLSRLSGEPAS